MFSICKQTHPATGVEFSISCHFFNSSERNLVTAGANILKVYRILPDVEVNSKEKYSDLRPPKMRLECLASFTLFGNVMSLQAVSLTNSQRDALLISFRDAKLSVVQFDPDTFDLKTLSLHYFEEEDIRGGWVSNYHIPMVRVDPDNRCAVMLVYGKKLVVLPFRRDHTLDEIEVEDVKPMKKTPMQLVARTPILASYTISLKDLDEKIDNVLDFQFLFGYYEPTLLILYEPVRTFPGRIAVRSDTCTMVAISLNIQQRVHPVIWSVSGLPFDCLQAMPVQKPIGGCLIVAVNAIIYLNQSIPPYGVSVNSIADHSTQFPLKPQDGVKMSLDAAQMTFIDADKLVISLNTGDLYVLTLCADSMRSVRSFHFSKAASSVLTSCICVCQEEYLFLGSRLGNSLLLRLSENDQNTVITIDDTEKEVPENMKETKQKRLEEEELEVYGSGQKTSVQLSTFNFEVCDSILNIGPISHMCVGVQSVDEEEDEETKTAEHLVEPEDVTKMDLEIVAASGYGKNGALTVLHNAIKPQVITSFGLGGCRDVWTVIDEPVRRERAEEPFHGFMILSQPESTMVLRTGEEINEVEKSGFGINMPTVFVGNIGGHRFIIQVTTKSIRLLQGTRLLQNIPLDLGGAVTEASIVDPYVAIRAETGQVITLALREAKGAPRLAINKNVVGQSPAVTAVCLYKDQSGYFTTKYEDSLVVSEDEKYRFGYMKPEKNMKVEDEEDLLYGDAGSAFKVTSMVDMAIEVNKKTSDWWRKSLVAIKPSYWLIVGRENGNLEIYSMPDLKLTYLVNAIGNGPVILSDSMEFVPLDSGSGGGGGGGGVTSLSGSVGGSTQETGSNAATKHLRPTEILMIGLGNHHSRPILFVRTGTELLVYRVYRYMKGNLKIRFRKYQHSMLVQSHVNNGEADEDDTATKLPSSQLRYFTNISGCNGVMVCGRRPYFVFLTIKGELRVHRLDANTTVRSFAAFNNVNCPNGFLYFDDSEDLKIAVLPSYLNYDSDWPMRKVPLRCTPKQVCYHSARKVYCVVTKQHEMCKKYFRFNGEDKELTEENKGERFMFPIRDQYQVVLVAPKVWEVVPDAKITLEEWECVTAFKNVSLTCEGTRSGLKEYICVGTNYNYGEDITSRGRILLYDIIAVVPEPGKPLTRFRLKEIYVKEQKGPVLSISYVAGFLITAVGQKIYLFQLKDNDLVGVAFMDTTIYVHDMVSIKNYILIADVYQSVSVLRFQEEYRTLSLVSRDFNAMQVYAIDYLVDNNNLGFLATDSSGNLVIFMYQPESRESSGGLRLMRRADYHLGQQVNSMFRIQCGLRDRRSPNYENKQITFFSTLDGGVGYCLPLPEKTYRRLFMLQNVLLVHSEHLCGLNPKVFRTVKYTKRMMLNPSRSVVDGELVWSFVSLPYNEKQEVAKKIGTKVEEIMADLMEIENVSCVL